MTTQTKGVRQTQKRNEVASLLADVIYYLKENNAFLKENNTILKSDHEIILSLAEDVRKIKFNTQ